MVLGEFCNKSRALLCVFIMIRDQLNQLIACYPSPEPVKNDYLTI